MSRGQSTQAFNTASNENATDFGNAQSAFGSTEDAIGNYNNQLAKFVSGNPYTPGGEYDQTINTGLANVSDAGAIHSPAPCRRKPGAPARTAPPMQPPRQPAPAKHPRPVGRPGRGATKAYRRRSWLQPGCLRRNGRPYRRQPVALWDIFQCGR